MGQMNLGVLKKDEVNVVVHGHEPLLPEMLVRWFMTQRFRRQPNRLEQRRSISLGMCCSANEILMRHGIPVAGNFLQQELAIVTGAVDAMVVDVQCEMQSLAQVAKCYHTKLITTSAKAKIEGAMHIEFDEHQCTRCGKKDFNGGHPEF